MKRIVITGATSFLGRNTIEELLDKGEYEVIAFLRKNSPKKELLPQHENVKYVYGSLDEIETITKAVNWVDGFVHFGWDGSGNQGRANDEIQMKNVEYSKRALQVAEKLGCRQFVFSGSQAEYGLKNVTAYETDECHPESSYGKAKMAFSAWAHQFVSDKRIQFIHLRIFSVYGYGDREGTLVDACIDKFNQGETMHLGPCQQNWNYLYIKDFSKILKAVLDKELETGIYNVASRDTRKLVEFVDYIYSISNRTGDYKLGEKAVNPEKSPALMPSIDKILNSIGDISFTPFEEGVRNIMIQKGYI